MSERSVLRHIPSVDLILGHLTDSGLAGGEPRRLVARAVRRGVERARRELSTSMSDNASAEEVRSLVFRMVEDEIGRLHSLSIGGVVNATGVVVHTNLGRAPLSARALERITETARGYSNLEYDLEGGGRGQRDGFVREALCELTGAAAALVVNNNAAAVLLTLNTLALGREVVVSRGELIEIGGSFRLPDVFERSGARMVAVGTTNRTHASDFEKAICNRTAALMSAHWSNYRISGFVDRVELRDLSDIAERKGLPLIHDLGSGILTDLGPAGLGGEMTISESVAAGATVVTASGDKILGGPQAGIAVGDEDAIARMRANPLMRALRPGKLTLAALQATLEHYLDDTESAEVPVIRMLMAGQESLRERVGALVSSVASRCGGLCSIEALDTVARVGGGAAPEHAVPSAGAAVRPSAVSSEQLAIRLREGTPPVVVRTADDRVIIDMRTVFPEQDAAIAEALCAALERRE